MLISHTHKFIFFHVAKAGGMSMREVLRPFAQEPEKFKIRRPPQIVKGKPNPLNDMWQALLLHSKARDAQKEFPEATFRDFYKFAFVRNPWDWQVSMYHFILKETSHVKHDLVTSLGSFEAYLDWVVQTKTPFPKGATKLQKYTITDQDGHLLVDFVGHYETLAQDFAHICHRLGLELSLPHINQTTHRDYRSYYNATTKQLVEKHFQADIALFGYTFEKSPVSQHETQTVVGLSSE